MGDSWFSSVKTATKVMENGHEWVGPVKTAKRLYPKEELESRLENWPGGMHLVMEGLTPDMKTLLAIGYKYNSRKVLCFLATKNAGATTPGVPYRARFVDDNRNLVARPVERPEVLSNYFKQSNCVDKHNHARQYELRLEKLWKTNNCWFRIVTTIIGIVVTDCWKAYKYSCNDPKKDSEYTICEFADSLAFELVHNKFCNGQQVAPTLSPLVEKQKEQEYEENTLPTQQSSSLGPGSCQRILELDNANSVVSPLTSDRTYSTVSQIARSDQLWDTLMTSHIHERNDAIDCEGKIRRRKCINCRKKTQWYCVKCKVFVCPDMQGQREYKCFKRHIIALHPNLNLAL
jgi:hypothetical protein